MENQKERQNWAIAIGGSETEDRVTIEKVYGTKDEVSEYIKSLIYNAKEKSPDWWINSQVIERKDGSIYARACWCIKRIDYAAYPDTMKVKALGGGARRGIA